MPDQRTAASVSDTRPWRAVALATAVAVITWAAMWLLAVPLEAVCPAADPGSVGCTAADRESAGIAWTIVVTVTYLVTVAIVTTVGRRYRWAMTATLWLLALVAIVAFGAVQGSTGYAIQ